MSSSGRGGSRTYRRGAASTTRSTSSVDTNLLLQRADDAGLDADDVGLDTARSAASVDTDVLLGDLASARGLDDPRRVSGTKAPLNSTFTKSTCLSSSSGTKASTSYEAMTSSLSAPVEAPLNFTSQSASLLSLSTDGAALNSTYTQSASLPHQLPSSSSVGEYLCTADDVVQSQVVGRTSHFHADRSSGTQLDRSVTTARSVASAECAPVDYDDDILRDNADYRGSSGFEVSILDKRHLSENSPSSNNDYSFLPAGSSGFDKGHWSEVTVPVNVHRDGSLGFETPVLNERRLSENDDTLCSLTGRSDSSLNAAMLLRDSTFSPAAADDVPLDSGTTSRTLASVDTDVLLQTTDDVVMAMEVARTNHLSQIPPRDPSPPARNDKVFPYKDFDRNTRENVYHSDADYETETVDVGNTGVVVPQSSVLTKPPSPARGKSHISSASSSYGRHCREAWGNHSDYDVPGDARTSKTYGGHKTVQLSQKRATSKVDYDGGSDYVGRPYTALRSEFDRRRHTTQLRSRPGTRTYPGQDSDRSLTSSASLGEKIVARSRQNQRPMSSSSGQRTSTRAARRDPQRDADLSESGLVLHGCRVQLRPSSASSHDRAGTRPSSAATRQTRPAAASSGGSQNGRPESSTLPAGLKTKHNGWTDDTSSLNDSLCVDNDAASTSLNQQVIVSSAGQVLCCVARLSL